LVWRDRSCCCILVVYCCGIVLAVVNMQSSVVSRRLGAGRALLNVQKRAFASQPSLDTRFPGIPELTPASEHEKPTMQMTTLPNGLRVASQETYGQVSALGVFVDSGSRYESDHNSGISHMLEHMAFKSSKERSHLRTVRDIEDIGGSIGAASSREYMIYQAETLRDHLETAIDIVADTVCNPAMEPWDVDACRKVISYELDDMNSNPQAVLTELFQEAAYGQQSPLGRPLWCPKRNLSKISSQDLIDFRNSTFAANRMVLSASGVDHQTLVDFAGKYFGDLPSSPANPAVSEKSVYRGGDRRISADSPLTHVAMCFDVEGWNSADLLEVCALQMILGGGGSFSAGGPGKGMYSRLYTNVLNKHIWAHSCTSFNTMYSDGGLLGIYGTCLPQDAGKLVDVMGEQLQDVANKAPDAEETMRGKNQLKSSILMKIESRQVLFEDIGRQLLTYGKYETPVDICKRIDAVTPEGIQKAAQKLLKSNLTLASFGDVSSVQQYDEVAKRFK